MSDMRLIVAGAGGRMGRTLVKAIADTKGLVLTGALEGDGSPLLGQDAGVLAGLPANGIKLSTDAAAVFAMVRNLSASVAIASVGALTAHNFQEFHASVGEHVTQASMPLLDGRLID